MFVEVTEVREIKRLQKQMAENLRRQFPHEQRRVIGWPAGHFSGDVMFSARTGTDVGWWYTGLSSDKSSLYNLFGRGDPKATSPLMIDLQFNFPANKFRRTQGGVFVRDAHSDAAVLAHRGIVTRGKSRVPRARLLQEANVSPVPVASPKSPHEVDVLLVGPIRARDLSAQISEFSAEVRRAAYAVMAGGERVSRRGGEGNGRTNAGDGSRLDVALNEYYDEFVGKTVSRRQSEVTMNCRHGSVVKALRERLRNRGTHYKSVAMDLVMETAKEVHLFEVKTGANTQSIYTGIGQLYFHAAALARKFRKPIVRNLVIPYAPAEGERRAICKELGINIVTFSMAGARVSIKSGV